MVLQRDRALAVWGWARPHEKVTVSLGTITATASADAAGNWSVKLPPQPASATPVVLVVADGATRLEVKDVLLGDVWLCSGQSNMSISAGHFTTPEARQDMARADYPAIRQFGVVEHFASTPQTDVTGEWLVCSPKTASRISAVAFYFAIRIHTETGVPVGIVRSAKGSTGIEMWLSQETLLKSPHSGAFAETMRKSLAAWEEDKAAAIKAGKTPDSADFPPYPFGEKVRRPRCVTLFNGMISPLAPMSIRGVVWYQGEGNAGDIASASQYRFRLALLIQSWRDLFGVESLPFYIVQLPGYRQSADSPGGGDPWSVLRESQQKCLSIPHTALAVTLDIGEADDIHPRNKLDVGNRLALLALKREYGKTTLIDTGPVYRELRIEGASARLSFDSVGSGLMIGVKKGREPAAEDKANPLGRFAIAGTDRKWFPADAVIDGNTVVVRSPGVPQPVAVRYAFSTNPVGANLYNRDGLPAGPFRTDDWPLEATK